MATDIKLDQQGGNWVVIEGNALKTTAADFMLDSPVRRRGGPSPHRRALVHDAGDGLTVNFAGDYPGGVTVVGQLKVTGEVQVAGQAVGATLSALGTALQAVRIDIGSAGPRLDQLEASVAALLEIVGAVIVPLWRTRTEILEGDDMGMVAQSAEALGLVVEYDVDQRNPNFAHEEVISLTPPAGTVVRRGSTVRVRINLEG